MNDLLALWETRAETLSPYAPEVAKAFRTAASELRARLNHHANEALTLTQAAQESGYSRGSLANLVSSGQIANVGKKGRPRIRRADLPKKPGIAPMGSDAHIRLIGEAARSSRM